MLEKIQLSVKKTLDHYRETKFIKIKKIVQDEAGEMQWPKKTSATLSLWRNGTVKTVPVLQEKFYCGRKEEEKVSRNYNTQNT